MQRFLNTLVSAGLLVHVLCGQDTQGLLKGRILDPHASAIPAAAIEIRNQQTLSARSIVSGPDGYFIAPNLQPGSYTVTVTAIGFQKYVRRDVVLETSQPLELSIQLVVGDLTQSVTVTDSGLDIDTAKGDP